MYEFRDGIQKDVWSKTSRIEPPRDEECCTGSVSDPGLGQETSLIEAWVVDAPRTV